MNSENAHSNNQQVNNKAWHNKIKIVCVSIASGKDWTWLKDSFSHQYSWKFYNIGVRNILDKLIGKVFDFAKHRACIAAGLRARFGLANVIVSHLPIYTPWVALFSGNRKGLRHLAVSFNFTKLPTGLRRAFMRRQFRKIDKFVVYSTFEKNLYSDYFNIPIEKIDMMPIGLGVPEATKASDTRVIEGDYVCAIGGEGRDYICLIEAARLLPTTNFVIVSRYKNLNIISIPDNVTIQYNIPIDEAFNIISHSLFAVVPLLHSEVPCGHITMVYSMHLGKAQVVTNSEGIKDYVQDNVNGLLYKPGDHQDLAEKIQCLIDDKTLRDSFGQTALKYAADHCSEEASIKYFDKVFLDLESEYT